MTKQFVNDLARTYNCETHYQGKTNTMFVHGENYGKFLFDLQDKINLSDLSFKIDQTLVWPLPKEVVSFDVDTDEDGNLVTEMIPGQRGEQGFTTDETKVAGIELTQADGEKVFVPTSASLKITAGSAFPYSPEDGIIEYDGERLYEILKGERTQVNKDRLRELIDQYLIANPVDRMKKGCYNETAERFHVTVDYVRDRYRKLRAKGLVEKAADIFQDL